MPKQSLLAQLFVLVVLFCMLFSACTSQTPVSTLPSTPVREVPSPSPRCPGVLFARERDLWRANLEGKEIERLTEGNLLAWQPGQGDWWMAFLSNPVQVSPDGRWLTFFSKQNRVLVDGATHTQMNLPMPGAPTGDWSPDSRYFAYGTDDGLYLYDIQKNQTTRLVDPQMLGSAEAGIREVVWSSDGRFIGFACCFASPTEEPDAWVGQIWKLEVSTGQIERAGMIRAYVARTNPLCWTADGQLAAAEDIMGGSQSIRCSAWGLAAFPFIAPKSPDGARQAVLGPTSPDGTGPARLTISNTATGEALWEREVGTMKLLTWSPDGQYLFLDDDQDRSPIWRIRADGSGELEEIFEDGFLLGVVSQGCWH